MSCSCVETLLLLGIIAGWPQTRKQAGAKPLACLWCGDTCLWGETLGPVWALADKLCKTLTSLAWHLLSHSDTLVALLHRRATRMAKLTDLLQRPAPRSKMTGFHDSISPWPQVSEHIETNTSSFETRVHVPTLADSYVRFHTLSVASHATFIHLVPCANADLMQTQTSCKCGSRAKEHEWLPCKAGLKYKEHE